MRKNCSPWKPIILKLVILRMLSKNAKASTSFAPFHPSTLLLKFIYEHTIHKHNLSMGVNCKIMHFVSFCSQHNETHLHWEANLLDWELKYWFPPRWGQWNRGARNSCKCLAFKMSSQLDHIRNLAAKPLGMLKDSKKRE